MGRAIAAILLVAAASGSSAEARGPRGPRGGGGFFAVQPHHGHPINAWLGSRRLRLR